jgi:hypothetical protein
VTQLHDAFAKLDADSRDNLVLRDIGGAGQQRLKAAKRLSGKSGGGAW